MSPEDLSHIPEPDGERIQFYDEKGCRAYMAAPPLLRTYDHLRVPDVAWREGDTNAFLLLCGTDIEEPVAAKLTELFPDKTVIPMPF